MLNLQSAILENGGFSYNQNLQSPETGFMVSLVGFETVIPVTVLTNEVVNSVFDKLSSFLTANQFVGAWVDAGKVYFDISENVQDKSTALTLAKERNQLAIFDLSDFTSIYL